jgi:hypothetical protein
MFESHIVKYPWLTDSGDAHISSSVKYQRTAPVTSRTYRHADCVLDCPHAPFLLKHLELMVWYGAPPTPWAAIVATRWWQLDRAPAEHAQTESVPSALVRRWALSGAGN